MLTKRSRFHLMELRPYLHFAQVACSTKYVIVLYPRMDFSSASDAFLIDHILVHAYIRAGLLYVQKLENTLSRHGLVPLLAGGELGLHEENVLSNNRVVLPHSKLRLAVFPKLVHALSV